MYKYGQLLVWSILVRQDGVPFIRICTVPPLAPFSCLRYLSTFGMISQIVWHAAVQPNLSVGSGQRDRVSEGVNERVRETLGTK